MGHGEKEEVKTARICLSFLLTMSHSFKMAEIRKGRRTIDIINSLKALQQAVEEICDADTQERIKERVDKELAKSH